MNHYVNIVFRLWSHSSPQETAGVGGQQRCRPLWGDVELVDVNGGVTLAGAALVIYLFGLLSKLYMQTSWSVQSRKSKGEERKCSLFSEVYIVEKVFFFFHPQQHYTSDSFPQWGVASATNEMKIIQYSRRFWTPGWDRNWVSLHVCEGISEKWSCPLLGRRKNGGSGQNHSLQRLLLSPGGVKHDCMITGAVVKKPKKHFFCILQCEVLHWKWFPRALVNKESSTETQLCGGS